MSKKYIYPALICALILALIIICFHPSVGLLPESNFTLSNDSRLPEWFSIPPGLTKKDVNVEIYYYAPPPFIRSDFKAILIGPPPENKILAKKIGISHHYPGFENDRSKYPRYNIAIIDGTKEIIEHREMEPIFYISDDPKLKKR